MRVLRVDLILRSAGMLIVSGLLPLHVATSADLPLRTGVLADIEATHRTMLSEQIGHRFDLSSSRNQDWAADNNAQARLSAAPFASSIAAIQPLDTSMGRLAESSTPLSLEDWVLSAFIGIGLIVYQLCRKHRMLRPQPFGF